MFPGSFAMYTHYHTGQCYQRENDNNMSDIHCSLNRFSIAGLFMIIIGLQEQLRGKYVSQIVKTLMWLIKTIVDSSSQDLIQTFSARHVIYSLAENE